MIHMRGARRRLIREGEVSRAQSYFTAFLPLMKDKPDFTEFVTGKRDRAAFRAERERRFAMMDRALAANRKRRA